MLKHYASFEERKDENEVKVFISANCPIGFVHDALFKIRSYIVDRINEGQKADAPKESETIKSE